MNNYKILINNEAESEEAQELFFELGYEWDGGIGKSQIKPKYNEYYLFAKNRLITYCDSSEVQLHCVGCSLPELTLPQLRDLAVLHRNDYTDATHVDQDGWKWFISSDNNLYVFGAGNSQGLPRWDESPLDHVDLTPMQKPQKIQEQGLICGADAKLAWAKGENVQFRDEFDKWYQDWTDLEGKKNGFWITDFDLPNHQFRLKPRTVKLEIEVPAPFEPKVGDIYFYITPQSEDGYDKAIFDETEMDKWLVMYGAWRTESDIIIVVEQLRKLGVLK